MTNPTPDTTVSIRIQGMSCGHCVRAVTQALSGVAGVRVRSVDVGLAVIESTSPAATDLAVAAIEDAGFEVSRDTLPPGAQA